MRRLTPLIACAAVGVLLFVCSPAGAIPPTQGSSGSPRSDPTTLGVAAQPLPTLVPPPNDAFGSAVVADGLPFTATVSTVEATAAVDDPFCFGSHASVWYAFTPSVSSSITADTFGSDYDTSLSAYTGTQGALTGLACNDDAGVGVQSEVRVPVSAGTTYYFMVAGLGAAGNLVFNLDAAPLALTAVKATTAQEQGPSADLTHFSWSQYARSGTRFVPLFVQESSGPRVRVNRLRTHGWGGGFAGDSFVYQEIAGRQSNLQLYDVVTGVRSAPPSGVNTLSWEWAPTMTSDHLLFGRGLINQGLDRVLLRDLGTGGTLMLDQIRFRNGFVWPGQVSGNYAVWFRCANSTRRCDVRMHDIAAGTTMTIPNPGRQQYSASVTGDGTVYFIRSRRGCGNTVQVVRRPLGRPSKVIAAVGPGRDVQTIFALQRGDGTTSVYFDRIRCSTRAWDVFSVLDP
jgi:hypothetical protein